MPSFMDQIGKNEKLVRFSVGQGVGKNQQDFIKIRYKLAQTFWRAIW